MIKKMLLYILCTLLIIGVISSMSYVNILELSTFWKIGIISIIIIIWGLSLLFKLTNLHILSKVFTFLFVILSIVIICYSIMYKYDLLYIFSSVTALKNYILSTNEHGVFIYILLQLLQVVFLPIPASIICIVGSIIYGPFLGGLYCTIGVLIGSYISFALGKIFGYKLVTWVVGKENTDKYSDIIRKRGGFFLGLAFLLPMFPDDILCFIAGITKMSVKNFFWITLITRPIGVICMAIFGSGYLIPFTGWGIYVWIGILIVSVALIWLVYKWQDNLQEFVLNKIFKRSIPRNTQSNT